MAWKGRTKPPVDYANLIVQLNNAKLQEKNFPLYQLLFQLINTNQQDKTQTNAILNSFFGDIVIQDDFDLSAILAAIANLNNLVNTGTFVTVTDETLALPGSRVLTAGTNVALDVTTPGQIIINVTGGTGGSYIPLATGTEPLTFMSDGLGQPMLIPFIP